MPKELVSIQIPVYNAEKFVAASLQSILAENDDRLEVIALDDCSTDRSRDILQELAANDRRLRVECNDHNLGEAGSRQRMVEMTAAELIMPFDADDIYLAGRLDRQRQILHEDPAYAATYGKTLSWDMTTGTLAYYSGRPFSNFLIFTGNPLGHGSILFRRSALLAAGGYLAPYRGEETMPVSCDYFMWMRLAQQGPLYFDNFFAYLYRMHGEQSAQTKTPLFGKAHQFMADWFKAQNAELLQHLLRQEPISCPPEQRPLLMQSLGFLTQAIQHASGDSLPFIRCAADIDPTDYGPGTAEFEYWRKKSDPSRELKVLQRMTDDFQSTPFALLGVKKMKLAVINEIGSTVEADQCKAEMVSLEQVCLGTPNEYRRIWQQASRFIS